MGIICSASSKCPSMQCKMPPLTTEKTVKVNNIVKNEDTKIKEYIGDNWRQLFFTDEVQRYFLLEKYTICDNVY